ncbi:hypothetical protein CYMTET_51480 [Cymbomonas tetramitiformis]|uniref:Sulfotransferase n=1 Tax=Cymbomonas tetramitiformis TaxID=36881 RepID=A0AAE0BKY8_9CHLO|nr:hypothetical protein CYMTET_51480 [Cymbomonas tetramitiformis]
MSDSDSRAFRGDGHDLLFSSDISPTMENVLVNFHIPKCAGTSFMKSIGQTSSKSGWRWFPSFGAQRSAIMTTGVREDNFDFNAPGCGANGVMHCSVIELDSCLKQHRSRVHISACGRPMFVGILRHPVDRVVSEFFWGPKRWCSNGLTGTQPWSPSLCDATRGQLTEAKLIDWITHKKNFLHNRQVKQVMGQEQAPVLLQQRQCLMMDYKRWQPKYSLASDILKKHRWLQARDPGIRAANLAAPKPVVADVPQAPEDTTGSGGQAAEEEKHQPSPDPPVPEVASEEEEHQPAPNEVAPEAAPEEENAASDTVAVPSRRLHQAEDSQLSVKGATAGDVAGTTAPPPSPASWTEGARATNDAFVIPTGYHEDVQAALAIVREKFWFIGLRERMQLSVDCFNLMASSTRPDISAGPSVSNRAPGTLHNKNTVGSGVRRAVVTDRAVELIEQHNELDLQFYNAVKAWFTSVCEVNCEKLASNSTARATPLQQRICAVRSRRNGFGANIKWNSRQYGRSRD